MHISTNPFAQAAIYWQLSFETNKALAHQAETYFDDVALSLSVFELSEANDIWKVDMVTDAQLTEADITDRLELLCAAADAAVPAFSVVEVAPEMWQHNFHEFPPLHIGRYLIHGSHITPSKVGGIYPICVDAGMAFGSGEHATTEGCLALFDDMMAQGLLPRGCADILDMGTGSAILAIAAAKRLPQAAITAVDIDAVSVKVARENAAINGVSSQVQCFAGDGYKLGRVTHGGPYDLIFANILARPLMRMAADCARALDEQGVVILSGLLVSQEPMVLVAYRMVGLRLKKRWRKDGWSALLLSQSS